jgi:hypothetical protein
MEKVEVTWGTTLCVWWSYFWRVMLFSAILGAILGGIGGAIVGIVGKPELGGRVGGVLGYLGSFPVSVWVLKNILSKKYKKFSVALVNEDNAEQ